MKNAPPNPTLRVLIALEKAATMELQRRTLAAHARILQLLRQHGGGLDARQRAAIRKYLKRPGS